MNSDLAKYQHARPNGQATKSDLAPYVFGKIQPQALPLEEAVLGAILIDREALPLVMDVLRPEAFYTEAHQHIYSAAVALFERAQPIDLLTLTEELRRRAQLEKAGGAYYLVELTNRVASAANIEYHARIIAQKALQRSLITLGTGTIREAYEDITDAFDLLERVERQLFALAVGRFGGGPVEASALARAAVQQAAQAMQSPAGIIGVPTGLSAIDSVTGGWRPGDLIIIAGRPAMGKTALVLTMAANAARDFRRPVAVFSLEMGGAQLMARQLASQARINGQLIQNGKLDDAQLHALATAAEQYEGVPMFIDETPGITLAELRARARRLKAQQDIQLIAIDYLQLMGGSSDTSKNANREQEIAGISRGLKALAKELQVPVIALSQLSRAVEIRGGSKRPILSDLRESGSIEMDADIVGFVYRPEYYNILEDETGRSLKGVAEFIIAKYRNGKVGTQKLKFEAEYVRFTDLPNEHFPGAVPGIPPLSNDPAMFNAYRSEPDEDMPF